MKKVLLCLCTLLAGSAAFSYDFAIKATPSLLLPFLSSGGQKYAAVGYGGFVDTDITLFDFLNVGPEFGFFLLPKNNAKGLEEGIDPNVMVVPAGLQAGITFYPLSRLEVGAGIAGGAYGSFTNSRAHYAPWYRAFGDVMFRINTKVSVGLNASWFNCQNNTWWGNPGIAGITGGIAITYRFSTEKMSGMIDASADYDDSVFPLIYTIYKENQIGTVTIENHESAEIRNVKVKFRAEGYTASEFECGTVRMIRKNKSEEVPLYADFTDNILRFTESGKVSGELVIEYDILGDDRVAVTPITLPVYSRNTMRWVDPAILSSYVSTNSQEVLEVSKYFVGIARSHFRTALNKNMQFSMYVHEGIRQLGIACEEKSDTPYNTTHTDPTALDYVQYPYQTLSYRSGDKDDIAILYMSMLESVGIGSAYIPLEDDFIVAIELGDYTSSLLNLFNGEDNILVVDDKVYLPISIAAIDEYFVTSWNRGVEKVNEALENDENVDFIVLKDAWQSYPPSGFSSGETTKNIPTEKKLYQASENDILNYVTQEFGPQIAEIQQQIKEEGASTTLYNRLGMLYVRAGMYQNAVSVYEVSAKMGSIPAMNNLGNILSLLKDYKKARDWYQKVLDIDPNNATARKNLEKIDAELER